ncbi:MAG: hypothetical protein L6N96_03940 [Candidatus Methylarchaceae archaeon HK02M2]|nr:hypothetical protein [Candidatus Methylarchaceae archaeon HK02M2]
MRKLSPDFIHELKLGDLNSILERVKDDNTLDFQIRDDYVNIYYRGGNLIKIEKLKSSSNKFMFSFDEKYARNTKLRLPEKSDIKGWIEIIPQLKHMMDLYFTTLEKNEREFQQLVVRENNYTSISKSTDYFIVDVEYDNRLGARFDLIAIEWESKGTIRKLTKGYKPKLVFLEIKYGDGALKGSSGIKKHIEDFKKFRSSNNYQEIKEEMKEIFKQKRDLRLIAGLQSNIHPIEDFSDNIDLVFLVINHDPESRKLKRILDEIEEIHQDIEFNIGFCVSNFMGYGLFKQNIFGIAKFKERFEKQIYCK